MKNFNEIYYDTLHTLYYEPEYKVTTRKGELIHECLNYSIELNNPRYCFALCRNMSFKYLKGELDFYISGSPYLQDIVAYSKFWNKVTDDGVTVNSNYGKLLLHDRNSSNLTQFEYAMNMLLRNFNSKKAVMIIYNEHHARISNDNPCTMYLQFFIRDDRLHLIVKMRSSDIWYGMPYDVPFFVFIQILMLHKLRSKYSNLRLGSYLHQSGSLHLYQRNFNEVETIFKNEELNLEDNTAQKRFYNDFIRPRLQEV